MFFNDLHTWKIHIAGQIALNKFKKYGKQLSMYSKNGLQTLLSQLHLALARRIFEKWGLSGPMATFWPISRLKLQNLVWTYVPNYDSNHKGLWQSI